MIWVSFYKHINAIKMWFPKQITLIAEVSFDTFGKEMGLLGVSFGRCTFRILRGGKPCPWSSSHPPSLPQIFSVISDTSCHTPYLFFKTTNCVTPPQIIFANLRRFPQTFDFPKIFICSNCKIKRYFSNFFKLTIWLILFLFVQTEIKGRKDGVLERVNMYSSANSEWTS